MKLNLQMDETIYIDGFFNNFHFIKTLKKGPYDIYIPITNNDKTKDQINLKDVSVFGYKITFEYDNQMIFKDNYNKSRQISFNKDNSNIITINSTLYSNIRY